jgi:hypothetical protein
MKRKTRARKIPGSVSFPMLLCYEKREARAFPPAPSERVALHASRSLCKICSEKASNRKDRKEQPQSSPRKPLTAAAAKVCPKTGAVGNSNQL